MAELNRLTCRDPEGRVRGLPGAGHLRSFGRFYAGAGPGAGEYDPAGQEAGKEGPRVTEMIEETEDEKI